ncbi:MAG: nucleotidyltransferase-like protein [Bacillus sp. (in: firmicutes)]
MEDILRPIYQERASSASTLGILLIEKRNHTSNITNSFDYILLVITDSDEMSAQVKHYCYKDQKAALHVVSMKQLQERLLLGSNRRLTEWLHNGKIIFDRNESITALKREIQDFPFEGRRLKQGLAFAKLVRRFVEGKSLFETGRYLDAYNHMIHCLHHLARLEVINSGFYPEVMVWEQIRHIEPQIYKLYEELVTSEESLEKRLELLFLASEFLIYSRTNVGVQHLVQILAEQEEPWAIADMLNHPELNYYSVDLAVLVEYLVDKGIIDVVLVETKGANVYHRLYKLS